MDGTLGRRLMTLVALAGAFLLTLPSVHPSDVVIALGVGAIAVWVGRPRPASPHGWSAYRPLHPRSVALFAAVVADSLRGTWLMARVTLAVREDPKTSFARVPYGARTEAGAALNGMVVTLAPGSSLVVLEGDHMLFHVVEEDHEPFVRMVDERYELQRPVLA